MPRQNPVTWKNEQLAGAHLPAVCVVYPGPSTPASPGSSLLVRHIFPDRDTTSKLERLALRQGMKKGSLGVTEQVFEKLGTTGDSTGVSPDLLGDVFDVMRSKVGETTKFEVGRDLLLRVQFRGVSGRPLTCHLDELVGTRARAADGGACRDPREAIKARANGDGGDEENRSTPSDVLLGMRTR